jgi:hypothetical protein
MRSGRIHRVGLSPPTIEYAVEGRVGEGEIEFHTGKPNNINKPSTQEMPASDRQRNTLQRNLIGVNLGIIVHNTAPKETIGDGLRRMDFTLS